MIICFSCSKSDPVIPSFEASLTLDENIDRFVESLIDENAPGLSLLVRHDSQLIIKKNYGLADIGNDVKVSSDTPFYLASVSKQITAMTTVLLKEEGKLSYEDSIRTYFPQLPVSWSPITIHDLLTHRSGIFDYLSDLNYYKAGLTNDEVFQEFLNQEILEFEPGSRYEYSNSGYLLLAMLTSQISGTPFNEFVQQNIFDPLNMSNSVVFDVTTNTIQGRARGYKSNGDLDDYEILTQGDGGIFSTVNDLDRWEQSFYSNELVSDESKEHIFTSYSNDNYGYGWAILKWEDKDWYLHQGGLNGYSTLIARFPEDRISIIILSNGSYDWIGTLHNEIAQFLLQN